MKLLKFWQDIQDKLMEKSFSGMPINASSKFKTLDL